MTKRQFVVLAFRLLALYILFSFVSNIGSFMLFARSESVIPGGTLLAIGTVGFWILGYCFLFWFLWAKSEWLMERIMAVPTLRELESPSPDYSNETPIDAKATDVVFDEYDTPLSAELITQIAVSVVGLLAVIQAVPQLLRTIEFATRPVSGYNFDDDRWREVLPFLLSLGFGLWLFLRPWQWQQWLWKLKANAEKVTDDE